MKTLSAPWVMGIALACLACVACKSGDQSEDSGVIAPPTGGATGGTSSGGTRAPAGGSSGSSGSSGTSGAGGTSTAGGAATSGSVAAGDDAGVGSCMAACEVGSHCELVEVQCVRAPCPAQQTCVADRTSGGSSALSSKIDCDPRKITCKRTPPTCAEFEAPSVDGSCFGPCIGIEECPCTGPEQCPDADKFTCHMSALHCTPFLR